MYKIYAINEEGNEVIFTVSEKYLEKLMEVITTIHKHKIIKQIKVKDNEKNI